MDITFKVYNSIGVGIFKYLKNRSYHKRVKDLIKTNGESVIDRLWIEKAEKQRNKNMARNQYLVPRKSCLQANKVTGHNAMVFKTDWIFLKIDLPSY